MPLHVRARDGPPFIEPDSGACGGALPGRPPARVCRGEACFAPTSPGAGRAPSSRNRIRECGQGSPECVSSGERLGARRPAPAVWADVRPYASGRTRAPSPFGPSPPRTPFGPGHVRRAHTVPVSLREPAGADGLRSACTEPRAHVGRWAPLPPPRRPPRQGKVFPVSPESRPLRSTAGRDGAGPHAGLCPTPRRTPQA